jgi:DNA-binding NarL/FixJ family response regulator
LAARTFVARTLSFHCSRMSLGEIVTRVLIVDDQPRARRSLHALLTAMHWSDSVTAGPAGRQIEIIDEASDSQAAIKKAGLLGPDVVVMELHRPELDGVEAIRMIRSRWPEVRIVVLTMYATDRAAALEAGADAFLLKGCSTSELLAAFVPEDGLE